MCGRSVLFTNIHAGCSTSNSTNEAVDGYPGNQGIYTKAQGSTNEKIN